MFCANVFWGLLSPIGKEALNSPDVSAITLTGLRIIGTAFLFWLFSFILPRKIVPKEKIDKEDWLPIVFASLCVTFANQLFVILGMNLTSPIDATVMFSTTPFFTLILVWLLWKVKHHWVKIAGVVVGFGGMLVFIMGGESNVAMNVTNPILGDIFCILSQVFGAIYMVKYAYLSKKYSPFTLMKWLFSVSAIVMFFVSGRDIISTPWAIIPMRILIEIFFVVVAGTFVAYILLPIGQRVLMPTSVAMYNYLQPIVSAVFSVAIGIATITSSTIIGSILIFTGVALVNRAWGANKNDPPSC